MHERRAEDGTLNRLSGDGKEGKEGRLEAE